MQEVGRDSGLSLHRDMVNARALADKTPRPARRRLSEDP
jgi:hypothetical protein